LLDFQRIQTIGVDTSASVLDFPHRESSTGADRPWVLKKSVRIG
jgi:hypothetical protein